MEIDFLGSVEVNCRLSLFPNEWLAFVYSETMMVTTVVTLSNDSDGCWNYVGGGCKYGGCCSAGDDGGGGMLVT